MIVFCTENGNARVLVCNARQPLLNVLDAECRFLFESGQCYLKLSKDLVFLHKEPVQDGCHLEIAKNGNAAMQCSVDIMVQEEGYAQYLNYQMPEQGCQIGSGSGCSVRLQNAGLPGVVCTVKPAERTVRSEASAAAALDGKILNGIMRYSEGAILTVMNLRMILFHSSAAVNQCGNIETALPRQRPVCWSQELPCPLQNVTRKFRLVHIPKQLVVDLEEPLSEENRTSMPLILTLGPAVTMSSAAMITGLISIYDGYQMGKEIRQLLPMIMLPGVMMLSTALWGPFQRRYETRRLKQSANIRQTSYLLYLESVRQDIMAYRQEVRQILQNCLPAPEAFLSAMEQDHPVWQKTAADDDWLLVRLGTGVVQHRIILEQKFRLRRSDSLHMAIQNLRKQYLEQSGMPVFADLKKYRRVEICYRKGRDSSYISYLFLQLSSQFHPDEIQLMLFCETAWLQEHSWLRTNPAFLSPEGIRMIANSAEEAQSLLDRAKTDSRWTVALVQTALTADSGKEDSRGICRIFLSPDEKVTENRLDLIIAVRGREGTMIEPSRRKLTFRIQDFDSTEVLRLNRRMQFFRSETWRHGETIPFIPFSRLYHCGMIPLAMIMENWDQNRTHNGVTGYLGLNDAGRRISLNLHERGSGPHGLTAGMTGSGKSEMIISFLLSLCVNYSPRELQIVMIDFKGGGSAQAFANSHYQFPHIAGTITDLDLNEMERALVSFSIECRKREMLLKKMADASKKSVMNIDSYQKSWKPEYQLPYLSHLLIVVDEFAELRKARPEFMADLISIARIGRSLGVHLLLSTQKAVGIVDDQIWANCGYKICMKMQDRQDSVEMIRKPDAACFRNPGRFCLLADGSYEFGQSAYANAPVDGSPAFCILLDQMLRPVKERTAEESHHRTQLTVIAEGILEAARETGWCAARIWKPPLAELHWQDIDDPRIILGRIDDFYHNEQPLFFAEKESCRTVCVYSLDIDEKMEFLKTILYSVLRNAKDNDEIYIIDDIGIPFGWIQAVHQIIDVFPSTDVERMENLQKHLEIRNRSERAGCFIILTHMPSFLESEPGNGSLFRMLLEKSAAWNIHLFVFTTMAASIHYRDVQMMQLRICLRNENLQDVISIFECTTRKIQAKKGFGLVKKENLLEFRYVSTAEEELKSLAAEIRLQFGSGKQYHLPAMPKHLHVPEHQPPHQPVEDRIGMDIATYQWVRMPAESLIVIAEYLDELIPFRAFCRMHLETWYQECGLTEAVSALKTARRRILFMTFSEYQFHGLKASGMPHAVLFIGSGYENQFVFQCAYRKPLKPNQGILFSRTRNQVIQLAEI